MFKEIENSKKESKWKQNRIDAYGSLLEFMRCLYNDTWLQPGYRIVAYVKPPDFDSLLITNDDGSKSLFCKTN